jgi:hypothetical protein
MSVTDSFDVSDCSVNKSNLIHKRVDVRIKLIDRVLVTSQLVEPEIVSPEKFTSGPNSRQVPLSKVHNFCVPVGPTREYR